MRFLAIVFVLLCIPTVSLAALNNIAFTRSQQLDSDFLLRWTIEDGQIRIGIEATAAGWVGFGITEAGGMKGADIVYFEAGSGNLVDAHALEYSMPLADVCQDWVLLSGSKEGGKIIVEATRPLRTDDNEDWELADDSEFQQGHAFIAAWGDSETISYHGAKRTSGRIQLFGSAPVDRLALIRAADSGIVESDILHTDNPIPARPTTYHEWCVDLQEAVGFDDAAAAVPRHVVAYDAVLDPDTEPYVHHFVVYGHASRDCGESQSRPGMGALPGAIVMGWAPGRQAMVMPPAAGLRIFGDEGYRSFVVQTHYNNPDRVSGLLDSSGLRLYHTQALRQHDIGVMQIGDPVLYLALINQQVASGWSKHSFECGKMTSDFEADEVTVFSRFLHMHAAGERMEVVQMRGDQEVRRDSVEVYDFEQSGGHDPVSTGGGFAVRKGDSFKIDCYYSNVGGRELGFGLGSQDEMCIDYLFYYPRQPLLAEGSCHMFSGNAQYHGEEVYEDVHGIGRVFGLACDGSEDPEGAGSIPTESGAARLGVVGFGWALAGILSFAFSAFGSRLCL